jgi:perosamine synthetase
MSRLAQESLAFQPRQCEAFVMSRQIPMSQPDISDEDIALVVEALKSKSLSMGPMLDRFERSFADYVGAKHAVAVSSGTAGLHLCIRAANIGPGDEVVTTPFSFVASANCILFERAKPVFVDIDESSMNIDPNLVRDAVGARTRAVLPVHIFGQPCAMDELVAVCEDRNLLLIEDACEAIGAEYRGRKVGTFGKAAVFGFYPNKQMTMGEGGVIATDDRDWAQLMVSLRNQGRSEMGAWLHHDRLGFNYRLDEMSAALGISQLARIEESLRRRDAVAALYRDRLRAIRGVMMLQPEKTTTRLSWFVMAVRLADGVDRNEVIKHLRGRGVPSRTYFSPIHLQPYFKEQFQYKRGDFPVAERIANSIIALPFYSNMPAGDIDYVVTCLADAMRVAA